jgi:hypothetical protein
MVKLRNEVKSVIDESLATCFDRFCNRIERVIAISVAAIAVLSYYRS